MRKKDITILFFMALSICFTPFIGSLNGQQSIENSKNTSLVFNINNSYETLFDKEDLDKSLLYNESDSTYFQIENNNDAYYINNELTQEKENNFQFNTSQNITLEKQSFDISRVQEDNVKASDIIINSANYMNFGMEKALFDCICEMKRILYGLSVVSGFSVDFFFDEFSIGNPDNSDDARLIMNDLVNGVLDLRTKENAKYTCLKFMGEKITSIDGLKNLNLSKIKTIILDGNEIKSINKDTFARLTSIENLSIANNKLKSLDLDAPSIKKLDLSGNMLESFNAINLQDGASVDLSFNNFSDIEAISSRAILGEVNLAFNKISNLNPYDKLRENLGCNPFLIVQNITNKAKFNDKISVFNDGLFSDFKAEFIYNDTAEGDEKSIYKGTICSVSPNNLEGQNLAVPAGKVTLQFSYSGEVPNAFSEKLKSELNKKYNFKIALKAPDYEVFCKNKKITNFTQNKPMKVRFKTNFQSDLPQFEFLNKNVKMYVGIQDKFHQTDFFDASKNGKYIVSGYLSFDGISGAESIVILEFNDLKAVTLSLVLLVIFFIVISCIVFVIKWVKGGAEIEPLSQKERYRYEKREMEKRYRESSQKVYHSPKDDFITKERKENSQGDIIDLGENKPKNKKVKGQWKRKNKK